MDHLEFHFRFVFVTGSTGSASRRGTGSVGRGGTGGTSGCGVGCGHRAAP